MPADFTPFEALEDPRMERTRRHLLVDIIAIALCAAVCGAEGWEEMEAFGLAKEDWLRDRLGLQLTGGIPSDDTFRRLFCRLDPEAFANSLLAWTETLQAKVAGEIIALDGKALRHSFDVATGQSALHLVNAWAVEAGIALGQVKVDDKSNEIKALPKLLQLLDIEGCVVTADAMGCQKDIAEQVVNQGGDYVLALKKNQGSLHADVSLFFQDAIAHEFYERDPNRRISHGYTKTMEKDHGRLEVRRCWTASGAAISWLTQREEWAQLQTICAVEGERRIGGKVTRETRYFISSLDCSATRLAYIVRSHWRIENSLHYILDVSMGEDACGIWKDNAPENLATLRRTALALLKKERSSRRGVKARGKRAGWDNDYLLKVLAG